MVRPGVGVASATSGRRSVEQHSQTTLNSGCVNHLCALDRDMPISPLQCRLGRVAAGITAKELADRANLTVNTVTKFERGLDVRLSSANAMQRSLEASGVVFVSASEASLSGGPGVRLAI